MARNHKQNCKSWSLFSAFSLVWLERYALNACKLKRVPWGPHKAGCFQRGEDWIFTTRCVMETTSDSQCSFRLSQKKRAEPRSTSKVRKRHWRPLPWDAEIAGAWTCSSAPEHPSSFQMMSMVGRPWCGQLNGATLNASRRFSEPEWTWTKQVHHWWPLSWPLLKWDAGCVSRHWYKEEPT